MFNAHPETWRLLALALKPDAGAPGAWHHLVPGNEHGPVAAARNPWLGLYPKGMAPPLAIPLPSRKLQAAAKASKPAKAPAPAPAPPQAFPELLRCIYRLEAVVRDLDAGLWPAAPTLAEQAKTQLAGSRRLMLALRHAQGRGITADEEPYCSWEAIRVAEVRAWLDANGPKRLSLVATMQLVAKLTALAAHSSGTKGQSPA